jgi:predicted Zn-dependent peptidase
MSIQTHEFKNGFKIVYQKSANRSPTTSINVFCDLGSIYEEAPFRGVSHLIEHMCYKGTRKLKNTYSMLSTFDEKGAYINAFTCKRYTCYTLECLDDYIKPCMILLSDMLLNSTFVKKEFEKEHRVVIEENIKDDEDNMQLLATMTEKVIYKGTPFEYPIDCTEYHNSKNLPYKGVIDIYNQFYVPGNMILSVVSNLSFDFFVKLIQQSHFHRETPSQHIAHLQTYKMEIMRKSLHSNTPQQNGIYYVIQKNPKIGVTNLSITFRTCSQYSEDKYVLEVLSNLLGGYFSSKLFMILREENGLTYRNTVTSNNNEFSGDFTITTITDSSKFIRNGNKKGVLPILIDILNSILKGEIKARELNIAKQNLHGKYELDMNAMNKISIYNGEEVLLFPNETRISYNKLYDTYYKGITLKDINRVIRSYFVPNNMNVCVLGKIQTSEKTIRSICENLVTHI